MSRVYVHSRKYRNHGRRIVGLVMAAILLISGLVVVKLYFRYLDISQSPQSTVSNSQSPLLGYITPYFLFKDTGKWIQDSTQTNANEVAYYEYVNGQAARQLLVYINKTPPPIQLAATRVLPVKVVGGDSLSAGSLSSPCASSLPAGQQSVGETTIDNTNILCDPSPNVYSVVLAQEGGSYQLNMLKSRTPVSFVIIYKDYSNQPNGNTIINIADSFKTV